MSPTTKLSESLDRRTKAVLTTDRYRATLLKGIGAVHAREELVSLLLEGVGTQH